MKIINYFYDLLNKDLKGKYEDKAFAIVIRNSSVLAVLYYLFMSTILFINSQLITGIGSFCGACIFALAVYFTYKISAKYVFWIYCITELVTSFVGVVYFGWHMGFQYTIMLLLIVTSFNMYISFAQKVITIISYAVMFIGMYFYTYYKMPWVVMHNSTDILVTVVSNINLIGSFCIAAYYFSSKSYEMSRNLIGYSKTLEKSAFFDTLTGLYNRREAIKFLDKFEDETDDDLLSVVICDIDLFKRINDSYGHQGGDVVLKEVAKLLTEYMNGKGIVSRWGGEEFLLVLPGVNLETATACANEILEQIRETYINYNGYVVQITMSFGVQQYDRSKTVDDMITAADKKLYKAKNSGRNRVIS